MRVLTRDGLPRVIRDGDILYFSSFQNTIYVHTAHDEYVYPISISELQSAYQDSGFERLDRSNIVNVDNVDGYDSTRKVVIFHNATGKYATVSEPNERKIRQMIARKSDKDSPK